MNHSATIDFNGAELNLSKEYHEARKLMGDKRTDLLSLYGVVSHIYIVIPEELEEWSVAYYALMDEIQTRERMMLDMKLDKLTG